MQKKILLIGCGNMGYAMLRGWLSTSSQSEFTVVEPNEALRLRAARAGARVVNDVRDISSGLKFDALVLAVKPQVVLDILPHCEPLTHGAHNPVFLSVAAGISTQAINTCLGGKHAIIRCMPNTPAAIGEGMMVCFANSVVSQEQRNLAEVLLSGSGTVAFVDDEALMDAVTAVSGSGPAYLFYFIEALTEAGKNSGLSDEFSQMLALQTIYGAAKLAKLSDKKPADLRREVTSPNGTTAAALDQLMKDRALASVVERAVAAAKARSISLGQV